MIRYCLAALVALALCAAPARAAIGTPVPLGSFNSSSGGTTAPITTGSSVAAGSLIFAIGSIAGGGGVMSGTADTTNPTYANAQTCAPENTFSDGLWYVPNATTLPSGDTVTITFNANQVLMGLAVADTGLLTSPLDKVGGCSLGYSSTPSLSTGTLSQANELVIGEVMVEGGQGQTFTEAPGFTTGGNVALTSSAIIHWAYEIVSSTASVTYAPTLDTTRAYVANVYSFKGIAPNASHTLMLMGGGLAANDNQAPRPLLASVH